MKVLRWLGVFALFAGATYWFIYGCLYLLGALGYIEPVLSVTYGLLFWITLLVIEFKLVSRIGIAFITISYIYFNFLFMLFMLLCMVLVALGEDNFNDFFIYSFMWFHGVILGGLLTNNFEKGLILWAQQLINKLKTKLHLGNYGICTRRQ